MKVNYKATIEFTEDQIKALLCTGFEGGVGYWCQIRDYKMADGLTYDDFREGGKMQGEEYWHPCQLVPLVPGCAVVVADMLDVETDEEPPLYELTREKIEAGLQLMADKFPRHFADFMNENDDAITGDVFIQCCVLGDCIYG
jgi:hypothetical protein